MYNVQWRDGRHYLFIFNIIQCIVPNVLILRDVVVMRDSYCKIKNLQSHNTYITLALANHIECKEMPINSLAIHTVLVLFGMNLSSFEEQLVFLVHRNRWIHKCQNKLFGFYCVAAHCFSSSLEVETCHRGLVSKGMSSTRIFVVCHL